MALNDAKFLCQNQPYGICYVSVIVSTVRQCAALCSSSSSDTLTRYFVLLERRRTRELYNNI
eukprot:1176613-Prorocentrum_minimum.AAC.1